MKQSYSSDINKKNVSGIFSTNIDTFIDKDLELYQLNVANQSNISGDLITQSDLNVTGVSNITGNLVTQKSLILDGLTLNGPEYNVGTRVVNIGNPIRDRDAANFSTFKKSRCPVVYSQESYYRTTNMQHSSKSSFDWNLEKYHSFSTPNVEEYIVIKDKAIQAKHEGVYNFHAILRNEEKTVPKGGIDLVLYRGPVEPANRYLLARGSFTSETDNNYPLFVHGAFYVPPGQTYYIILYNDSAFQSVHYGYCYFNIQGFLPV